MKGQGNGIGRHGRGFSGVKGVSKPLPKRMRPNEGAEGTPGGQKKLIPMVEWDEKRCVKRGPSGENAFGGSGFRGKWKKKSTKWGEGNTEKFGSGNQSPPQSFWTWTRIKWRTKWAWTRIECGSQTLTTKIFHVRKYCENFGTELHGQVMGKRMGDPRRCPGGALQGTGTQRAGGGSDDGTFKGSNGRTRGVRKS